MAKVDPDALRELAKRFDSEVGAQLTKAATSLQKAQGVSYSNFTSVQIPLAMVYVEAYNFEARDLQRKIENASEFGSRLGKTADDWAAAEKQSTIQPGWRALMGTPLDAGKGIAEYALISTTIAAAVIPDAWPLAGEFYKLQCDPGAQYAAGEAWIEVAGHLGDAVSAAEAINNSVAATGWEGPDQEAYSAKVADYIRELMVGQVFAMTVGIALIISSIALFVAMCIAAVMASGLLIWMGVILAAIASVVGNFGLSEELEADAMFYAFECIESTESLNAVMTTTDAALAAGIGAFLTGDIGVQFALGDHDVLADLGQATVDGIGTVTTGLLARVYRNGIGSLYGNYWAGGAGVVARGLGLGGVLFGETPVDKVTEPWDPAH